MRIGPNIRKRADGRFEARYIKSRTAEGKIVYGFCYGKTYKEAEAKRNTILGIEPTRKPDFRQMNLLILGAGGQSQIIKEAAESLNIFNKISCLDDDSSKTAIIDDCDSYLKYLDEYPAAFVSFGNNELRSI